MTTSPVAEIRTRFTLTGTRAAAADLAALSAASKSALGRMVVAGDAAAASLARATAGGIGAERRVTAAFTAVERTVRRIRALGSSAGRTDILAGVTSSAASAARSLRSTASAYAAFVRDIPAASGRVVAASRASVEATAKASIARLRAMWQSATYENFRAASIRGAARVDAWFVGGGVMRSWENLRGRVLAVGVAAGEFGSGVKTALSGALPDLQRTARLMSSLSTTTLNVGSRAFGVLRTAAVRTLGLIRTAALGAGLAVAGLLAGLSAATASGGAGFKQRAVDSKALGISPENLGVYQFAAERAGTDREEIVQALADISSEAILTRESLEKADRAYASLRDNARAQWSSASSRGDRDGLLEALQDVQSGGLTSLTEVRRRIAEAERRVAGRVVAGGGSAQRAADAEAAAARRQLETLRITERGLVDAISPQGQALANLEAFGLNLQRATQGGEQAFDEILRAFPKVEDASERMRIAVGLFGEDAGRKLVPILRGGRQALDEYRRDIKRLGGVVTETDLALGDAFDTAKGRLGVARDGLRNEIARAFLPDLTASTNAVADWVATNRKAIADSMKSAFDAAKAFAHDLRDALGGKRSGFETEWLDAVFARLRDGRAYVTGIVAEFRKLGNGGDTRWAWVNRIRDGLKVTRDFARDVVAVFSGQDASRFAWINTVRDGLLRVWEAAKGAFDLFLDSTVILRDAFKNVSDFLGIDPLKLALYLGLAKISGLLGVIGATAGMAGRAILGAFGVGAGTSLAGAVGSAAASAVGGGAVAGAAGAAGSAAAGGVAATTAQTAAATAITTAGTTASAGVTAAGTRVALAIGAAGTVAATALTAAAAGVAITWAGDKVGRGIASMAYNALGYQDAWDQDLERQARQQRERDERYRLLKDPRGYRRQQALERGIVYDDPMQDRVRDLAAQGLRTKPGRFPGDVEVDTSPYPWEAERQPATRRVEVELTVAGKPFSGSYEPSVADQLVDTLSNYSIRR